MPELRAPQKPIEEISYSKRADIATGIGLSVVMSNGVEMAQNESGKSGRVITNAQWLGGENNTNYVKGCNSRAYLIDSDLNRFDLVNCAVIYGEGGIGQLEGNPDYFIIAADLPLGIVNKRRQKRNTNLLISKLDLMDLINTSNSDPLSVLHRNPELTKYVLGFARRRWKDIPSSYHNFQSQENDQNQFNSSNKIIKQALENFQASNPRTVSEIGKETPTKTETILPK